MALTSFSGSEAKESDKPGPDRERILFVALEVVIMFLGTVIDSELRALRVEGTLDLFDAVSSPISIEWEAERFIAREVLLFAGPGAAAASCSKKFIFFVTNSLIWRT